MDFFRGWNKRMYLGMLMCLMGVSLACLVFLTLSRGPSEFPSRLVVTASVFLFPGWLIMWWGARVKLVDPIGSQVHERDYAAELRRERLEEMQ